MALICSIEHILMFLLFCAACIHDTAATVDVNAGVDISKAIFETDERYLSVVMGPTTIRHNWSTFDFSSPRLHKLASALSPAILRLGGNEADLLIFNKSATNIQTDYDFNEDYNDDTEVQMNELDYGVYDEGQTGDPLTNFIMTAQQWDQLNNFTKSVGWNLLFDLNVLLRKDGEWDSTNALELIKYSIEKNYTNNLNFELGNEPNAFKHYINRTVDPKQLGKDFQQLHYILRRKPGIREYFTDSLLVGPDITRPRSKKVVEYLYDFLSVAGESLSAITWHQYYMDGRNATAADFMNPAMMEDYVTEALLVRQVRRELGLQHKPLMMGETSSCWGGGAPYLSNRYVAGFLWLDKLGLAAQMGHSIVMRQTFYEGHYGLIDKDLFPNPDYWLSVVFKGLAGTRVLNTTTSDSSKRTRVYAHCTHTRSGYKKGDVTVFALNLYSSEVNLVLNDFSDKTKHIYWFTPHGKEGFSAKYVDINGKKMKLIDDIKFPEISPKVTTDKTVPLPPTSFGFIVIVNAQAPACMNNKM